MLQIRLKKLRETKGISQRQLADILNVSRGSVGNWESGTREPNLNTIRIIADFFGITIDYLLGVDDKPYNKLLDLGSIESDILNELADLTDHKKEEVLNFIKFLKDKKD